MHQVPEYNIQKELMHRRIVRLAGSNLREVP